MSNLSKNIFLSCCVLFLCACGKDKSVCEEIKPAIYKMSKDPGYKQIIQVALVRRVTVDEIDKKIDDWQATSKDSEKRDLIPMAKKLEMAGEIMTESLKLGFQEAFSGKEISEEETKKQRKEMARQYVKKYFDEIREKAILREKNAINCYGTALFKDGKKQEILYGQYTIDKNNYTSYHLGNFHKEFGFFMPNMPE